MDIVITSGWKLGAQDHSVQYFPVVNVISFTTCLGEAPSNLTCDVSELCLGGWRLHSARVAGQQMPRRRGYRSSAQKKEAGSSRGWLSVPFAVAVLPIQYGWPLDQDGERHMEGGLLEISVWATRASTLVGFGSAWRPLSLPAFRSALSSGIRV
jgi:hypothetical protein